MGGVALLFESTFRRIEKARDGDGVKGAVEAFGGHIPNVSDAALIGELAA